MTLNLWSATLCLSRSPLDPNSIRAPESPFGRMWLSLPPRLQLALELNWPLFNSSALYYLQTPTQRYGHASMPPQFLPISGDRDVSLLLSLEWPVWSSSSGNNCHAVQRSLSSGASLCSGTVGPSPCPILSALIRPRDLFRLLAIGMCHFLPVHHLGIAFLAGSKGQNITYIYPWRPRFNPRLSHTKDSKKWYLKPPCLILSIIRYISRVKWSNPRKGVVSSPTPWCCSYWKGSLWVTLNYSHQLYLFTYTQI